MTATLNAQEEHDVLDAVKAASDHVGSGLSPTAAIVKVAQDRHYGAGMIRLLSHAFNTGQQNAQWQAPSRSILEKLATFELADAEAAIASIYGEKTATDRLGSDYARPPDWLPTEATDYSILNRLVKAATAETPTRLPDEGLGRFERSFSVVQSAKHAAENAAVLKTQVKQALHGTVAGLVAYFKQAAATRRPFGDFRLAAEEYYGALGSNFCDLIASQSRCQDKQASEARHARAIDWTASPFRQLREGLSQAYSCVDAVKEADDRRRDVERLDAEVKASFFPAPAQPPVKQANLLKDIGAIATGDILAHRATYAPSDKPKDEIELDNLDQELDDIRHTADAAVEGREKWKKAGLKKQAGLFGAPTMGAVGAVLGRALGSPVKTKDDLVDDAYQKLEDPAHMDELRKIRTQAMLTQMLTDPEDPISGHKPEKVLQAHNEISQTTPRLADTAATLRPLLRRRLESHQEPFEVKEMLDTEKSLAATRQGQRSLVNNSDKPLG